MIFVTDRFTQTPSAVEYQGEGHSLYIWVEEDTALLVVAVAQQAVTSE
jgi:hypothetical protein